jgi:S-adenosylmethionine:tRNA-ribosyltransferase-isomerase (queuine synthetase)
MLVVMMMIATRPSDSSMSHAVDQEEVVVEFADAFTLMRDLRGMGESNAQHFRRPYVPRSTMYATAAAYQALYGKEDGRVPATFQVILPPAVTSSAVQC